MSTISWVILVIVILVIVAVVVFFVTNRRAGARRARAEQIRQEATQRAAELDRKEADANAMAAQAQDARAEADRLESVSAEQRQETAAARDDVEESLRKADSIDPDPGRRSADVDDSGAIQSCLAQTAPGHACVLGAGTYAIAAPINRSQP